MKLHHLLHAPGRRWMILLAFTVMALWLFATNSTPTYAATTWTVTRLDDRNNASCVAGDCSLREAIKSANLGAGGDTINFASGLTGTILLTVGALPGIGKSVTIDGGSQITLTGNLTTRLFTNSATLTLQNIILDRAGSTGSDGGAITNSGTLNLQNSTIQNSQTDNNHSGGAIFSSGPVNISNSTLKNNTGGSAGAMFINNALAVAQISNSTFSNNKTTNTITGFGGAIWVGEQAQVSITGGAIISNSAQYGGGLYLSANATVTLSSAGAPAIVTGNSATTSGGGVDNSGGHVTGMNATFSGNSAAQDGGGVYNNGGHVTLTNAAFSGNAAGSGGGLANDQVSGMATLTNVTLSSNSAAFGGGGIYNNHGTAMLANVIISSNVVTNSFSLSTYGGGIENYGTLTLTNSTLRGNSASNNLNVLSFGGGLYNNYYTSQDTAALANVTLSGNSAYAGGGILNVGTLTLTNSTLSANSATSTGGGIENYQGTAMVTNVTLSGNSANTGGGIFQQGQAPTQTITLKNTILVSGPSGANCYEDPSSIGSLLSNGYNLTSEGTCAPYIHNTGDVNNENPNLGPLANNGGPTFTQMPSPPSKAIDAIPNGTNGCGMTLTTDQRGAARPINGKCDIGAVEYGWLYLKLWLPLIVR